MATLLLADDSSTIQRVIELTFADEGITVTSVGTGRAAIEHIKATPPDIVLADIGMPEGDGYDVGAFVKGDPALKRIPVLLLTGALEPLDEARARAVCDGVLVKPFEPQVVINRVRKLIAPRAAAAPAPISEAPGAPAASAAPVRVPTDVYFERLGATVDSPGGTPAAIPLSAAPRPAERRAAPPSAPVTVSLPEAFAALLAAEQGAPVAPSTHAAPFVTDALIDDVATRVIQRLGDETMRQAVLEAAERLVREEIARIKGE
jgi:CheY-like chemotaxis protein